MKTKLLFSLLLTSLFFIYGCSSDDDGHTDVDGLPPTIALTASHVKSEKGRDFHIEGKIEDKDGLKSIHLKNRDIYLDKVIDLSKDSLTTVFDLDYKFNVRKEVEGESFNIQVVATDLGGRTTEETLLVTMDGDFTAPVFTLAPDENITVLIKTETKFSVKFKVDDDKALDLVTIEIPEISYEKEVTTFTNSGKTLEFNDFIIVPSTAATYNLIIKAIDKAGLTTERNCTISVSEMPDFTKMYLVDVDDAAMLNSDIFGIPMLIERTAAYTYRARYYSEKAGTKVRFVPQKTDFSPICFGTDPSNSSILTDDPDTSVPITLSAKGYYEIVFNVKTGSYSVNTYTPSDTPIPIGSPMHLDGPSSETIPLQIGLIGDGVPNAGSWNPAEPLVLEVDSDNPYLLYVEMNLEAGKEIEFMIGPKHSWGWWPEPFWRWDRSEDPEANVSNGGENPAKWKISTSGKYMFKFDSHLKRSKFYPIN